MANIDTTIQLTEEERKVLVSAKKVVNNILEELWRKDIDGVDFSDRFQCLSEGFDIIDNYLE